MSNDSSFRHILALDLNSLKKTIFLEKNTYSIGRNYTSSIVIHHRLISRNHATLLKVSYRDIKKNNDIFWILDGDLKGNRSTNGIYVNGKRCLSHELKPGDTIVFGGNEIKAKYDILDVSSKQLISLLKDNETISDRREYSPQENDISTLVADVDENKEPLTEEFITKINSLKDLGSYPIIEIDFQGEITKINSAAEQKFNNIKQEKSAHPILEKLTNIFSENNPYLLVRKITIGSENFIQYAHGIENNQLIIIYVLDFQKYKQLELALRESEQRYQSLVKQISEGIFLLDIVTKKILDANPAYCNLLGYSFAEILELSIYDLLSIDREILHEDLQRIVKEKTPFIRESIHRRKDGSLINVEVSVSFIFYLAREVLCFTVRDITKKKRTEQILRYQAGHDLLTNLPNQKLFYEQLSTLLANAKNNHEILALMFIKLDRFKNINYTLGHSIGDQLLQEFVKRIKSCLSSGDTLARWGGDEFTVLLPDIENADNVANISQTIIEQIKEPFTIAEHKLHINISLGIAFYPQNGEDASTLLKNADAALCSAQQRPGNKYQFYTPQMTFKAQEKLRLENLLHSAFDKEEFYLSYQPQINVKTGEITAMEAILQWRNRELGEVPLEQFLPIAEDSGLIMPINYWVIKTACEQNQAWQQNGFPPTKVAVKLYSRPLQESNLLSLVTDILAETKLEPNFLELEMQEVNIIKNWEYCRKNLHNLRQIGINLSIDNFGAGDFSLSHLGKFKFSKLKIAQNLVDDLEKRPENLAIISAIITLGLGFNMKVVAKGITKIEQMELLKNLQCEQMQGELFSEPLNAIKANEFLSGKQGKLIEVINKKTIFDMLSINNIGQKTQ